MRAVGGLRGGRSAYTVARTAVAPHRGGFMAKAGRKRKSYSDAQRKQILDAAQREGLTAMDVKKRFGVTPSAYRKQESITVFTNK